MNYILQLRLYAKFYYNKAESPIYILNLKCNFMRGLQMKKVHLFCYVLFNYNLYKYFKVLIKNKK